MSVIPNLSRAAYDGEERESFSTLKHLARSPAHFLAAKTQKRDSSQMLRGRVVHTACLEPHRFNDEVKVYPGERRGNDWKKFEAAHAGKEIITESEYAAIEATACSVRTNPQVMPYLEKGQAEVSILWECDGVKLKSRIDWLCHAVCDLKSSKTADPARFPTEVANYFILAQGAMYVDALKFSTGEEKPFVILVAEAEAPYVAQVFTTTPEQLEVGRHQYRGWLAKLKACRASNRWEAYAPGEVPLIMPQWWSVA